MAFATRAPSRPTQQGITVWLTDLATCRARDVKGLYARHARGELPPPQFSRPEVARLLADGYRAQRG